MKCDSIPLVHQLYSASSDYEQGVVQDTVDEASESTATVRQSGVAVLTLASSTMS